eukprot:3195276-Amphidinium_carterae.1
MLKELINGHSVVDGLACVLFAGSETEWGLCGDRNSLLRSSLLVAGLVRLAVLAGMEAVEEEDSVLDDVARRAFVVLAHAGSDYDRMCDDSKLKAALPQNFSTSYQKSCDSMC